MRSLLSFPVLALAATPAIANAQPKPIERQITEAVSPLPEGMREGATVMGYAPGVDTLGVIRLGLNMMICIADDPMDEGFHVACYHRDLEPFMARGRHLRAQGKTAGEIQEIRAVEIESGRLKMPKQPTALYSYTGAEATLDPVSGQPITARLLHVVYIPYATEETTGLSTEPSAGRPWLMFPGTPWAHIMISRP